MYEKVIQTYMCISLNYMFIIRIYAFLAHSIELHPSLLSAYTGLYASCIKTLLFFKKYSFHA